MKTLSLQQDYIENSIVPKLAKIIQKGIDSWTEAGELIVEAIDKYNANIIQLSEICRVPRNVIASLEKVGRKQVIPSLLIATYPAGSLLPRLPYSQQKEAIESGVELLTSDGDTMIIKAENLSLDQARQVVGNGSLRNLAAQKAYMEDQKKTASLTKGNFSVSAYKVRGTKIFITQNCTLEASDLIRMLSEIQK